MAVGNTIQSAILLHKYTDMHMHYTVKIDKIVNIAIWSKTILPIYQDILFYTVSYCKYKFQADSLKDKWFVIERSI